jgi:outer membrane receptor protein involved in Fe transport
LRYSFTDATFRSDFSAYSHLNSEAAADGGAVRRAAVAIPRHSIKLRAGYEFTDRMAAGLNVMYFSDTFARGDENNADVNGRIPGYAVVNLDGQWRLRDRVTLALQVNNLFDRRYENFGLLGADFFTGPNGTFGPVSGVAPANTQFRGPGAPRELRLTLRYRF